MKKITLFLWALLCFISLKAAIGDTFTEEYNGIVMKFRYVDDTGKNVELGSGNMSYNAFYEGNINGNHSNPTGIIHVPQRVHVATYEDYVTVVGIGDGAFNNCSGVTGVVFDGYAIGQVNHPSEITYIKAGAFNRCTSLTSIDLTRITSIGEGAFSGCTGLTSINLTHITSIGRTAFSSCTGFTSITFPSSVTTIGDDAFRGCTNLASITINNGVQSIGSQVFDGTNITSVYIPASVTSIGGGAFCSGKLTSITVASGSPFTVTNGCLISPDNSLVQATVNATSIPNTVTSIGAYAFYNNKSITSVNIPYGFTGIGGGAFWNCSNLATVTSELITPFSVSSSFGNISPSATLTIPNGTTSDYSTKGWNKYYEGGVYKDCFKGGITETPAATLVADNKTITYGDALPTYTYMQTVGETLRGTPALSSNATGSSNAGNYTITIAKGSVENKNVTYTNGSLTINKAPLTITAKNYTIMVGAAMPTFGVDYAGFVKNQTKTVLSTQPTVTCSASNTNTPGTYTLTPSGAAAANYDMNYVAGTLTILPNTFTANTVENVPVEYKVLTTTTVAVGDGVSMEHVAIDQNTSGTVTIPSTVTYGEQELTVTGISFRAFHNCANITGVTLPSTITSIGAAGFARCTSLTSFTIPENVTSIGEGAFQFDNLLATVPLNSGLQSIGNDAFSCTAITSVAIPSSVTYIGNGAFGSTTLESITATNNSNYTVYNNSALVTNTTHKLIQATKTMENIPGTVTTIGTHAFTYIPFSSITIPSTVTAVEQNAFNGCSTLQKVFIYAPSLTTYGTDAFGNNASGRKIYVLSDKVGTYQTGWSSYSADILPITLTSHESNSGSGEYWSTYYNSDANVTVASGTTIYKAKINYDKDQVILTSISGDIIKAGQAVVLKSSTGSIELSSAAGDGSGDYTDNKLRGVDVRTLRTDVISSISGASEIYVMGSTTTNGFGFHKYTGDYVPANKAFLALDAQKAARALAYDMVIDEEESGIDELLNSNPADLKSDVWYTINGVMLNGIPTQSGVYIYNGKKIVVK